MTPHIPHFIFTFHIHYSFHSLSLYRCCCCTLFDICPRWVQVGVFPDHYSSLTPTFTFIAICSFTFCIYSHVLFTLSSRCYCTCVTTRFGTICTLRGYILIYVTRLLLPLRIVPVCCLALRLIALSGFGSVSLIYSLFDYLPVDLHTRIYLLAPRCPHTLPSVVVHTCLPPSLRSHYRTLSRLPAMPIIHPHSGVAVPSAVSVVVVRFVWLLRSPCLYGVGPTRSTISFSIYHLPTRRPFTPFPLFFIAACVVFTFTRYHHTYLLPICCPSHWVVYPSFLPLILFWFVVDHFTSLHYICTLQALSPRAFILHFVICFLSHSTFICCYIYTFCCCPLDTFALHLPTYFFYLPFGRNTSVTLVDVYFICHSICCYICCCYPHDTFYVTTHTPSFTLSPFPSHSPIVYVADSLLYLLISFVIILFICWWYSSLLLSLNVWWVVLRWCWRSVVVVVVVLLYCWPLVISLSLWLPHCLTLPLVFVALFIVIPLPCLYCYDTLSFDSFFRWWPIRTLHCPITFPYILLLHYVVVMPFYHHHYIVSHLFTFICYPSHPHLFIHSLLLYSPCTFLTPSLWPCWPSCCQEWAFPSLLVLFPLFIPHSQCLEWVGMGGGGGYLLLGRVESHLPCPLYYIHLLLLCPGTWEEAGPKSLYWPHSHIPYWPLICCYLLTLGVKTPFPTFVCSWWVMVVTFPRYVVVWHSPIIPAPPTSPLYCCPLIPRLHSPIPIICLLRFLWRCCSRAHFVATTFCYVVVVLDFYVYATHCLRYTRCAMPCAVYIFDFLTHAHTYIYSSFYAHVTFTLLRSFTILQFPHYRYSLYHLCYVSSLRCVLIGSFFIRCAISSVSFYAALSLRCPRALHFALVPRLDSTYAFLFVHRTSFYVLRCGDDIVTTTHTYILCITFTTVLRYRLQLTDDPIHSIGGDLRWLLFPIVPIDPTFLLVMLLWLVFIVVFHITSLLPHPCPHSPHCYSTLFWWNGDGGRCWR